LIPGMAHEINADTEKEIKIFFGEIFKS